MEGLHSNLKSDIKILIVDDREDNLFSIQAILEKDNYNIVRANSGRAALKILLKEFDFSLILMDVQMPDLNGFETASIIYERDRLKSIPIIFITAHDYDEEFVFKGYRMGAVDYIYKPINPELLRAKVSVFVELYRKNQQLMRQEKKLLSANRSLQREIEERRASEEKVKCLNEQLVENNAHLKEINEELDQFAYVASHDLQEPLRKIMLFSDKILEGGELDAASATLLQKIIRSSTRMQMLINDLLTLSRGAATEADFTLVNLGDVVREAISELEVEIEKSGASFEIGDLPEVWVIPSLIQQLFHNLLSNAIKFRRKLVPPVVKIFAERFEVAGSAESQTPKWIYKVSVSDNGIGFDSKYSDEVFRVFKRLHNYSEYEGSGVGLSICRKIAEKHQGTIRVESVPNQGTTFEILLPEHPHGGEIPESMNYTFLPLDKVS
ncbi:MAG TPA: response regulator [Chitinophagaceae bacterium]|nr:response regulator [Chitinophagaceae bacterium]